MCGLNLCDFIDNIFLGMTNSMERLRLRLRLRKSAASLAFGSRGLVLIANTEVFNAGLNCSHIWALLQISHYQPHSGYIATT
jgi:hypothetical protein